ncbi:MAG: LacI family DNA-binding transcriptional regulator [Microscillaceae bacterium]
MKTGQITIKDIARQLNISPSTVSRALKDHPDISQETKKLVNELARQLEYEPNQIAQSLRQSKTFTLGVVIPSLVHHFFSSVISGMEDVAHDRGYNLILTQSNESFIREQENVRALLSSRVDGIFVSMARDTQDYAHFHHVEKREIPLIFFDRVCEDLPTHRVVIENFEGAFAAVSHLLRSGCRRIVHLAGPENLRITNERLRGYYEAHQQFGLTPPPALCRMADHRQAGREAVQALLAEAKDFDGIFTVNDDTAIGALQALQEAGRGVPEEVSVIGFGDSPLAEIAYPPLSTVAEPGFVMGQAVVQLFLEQSERLAKGLPFVPKIEVFPTQLVLRASTRRLAH